MHTVGFWRRLLATLLGACARATARQSHGQQRRHYDLDAFRPHMPALIKTVQTQHSTLSNQLQTWLHWPSFVLAVGEKDGRLWFIGNAQAL
jgi:hypothetical protein